MNRAFMRVATFRFLANVNRTVTVNRAVGTGQDRSFSADNAWHIDVGALDRSPMRAATVRAIKYVHGPSYLSNPKSCISSVAPAHGVHKSVVSELASVQSNKNVSNTLP